MIKCRGARGPRAADGSWRFTTEILSFCRRKDVTLGTFSVCIYIIIEWLSKPLNLRRCEGKMAANFENDSSFHEHGPAFWRFESATFRFALMVIIYYANFRS